MEVAKVALLIPHGMAQPASLFAQRNLYGTELLVFAKPDFTKFKVLVFLAIKTACMIP
jgi:hypothetical protein